MYKKQLLFLLIVFTLCCITIPCLAFSLPTGDFSREKAINTFFKDKPENTIEGIWATDDDKYEIAIVKNSFSICKGYDYLGFITQTTDSVYKPGDVKLQLKSTAIPKLFIGSWHDYKNNFLGTEKYLTGTTYRLAVDNILEYINEKKQRKLLYRIYPSEKDNQNKQTGSGTGFFITSDLIVTNYHVVKDAKAIDIVYKNDHKATATILAKDPTNDLALLKVKDLDISVNPLIIGNVQESKDGNTVYAVGFPMPGVLGDKAKLSEGIINSVTGFKDDVRMYQISIPIQPGNSGSPLINTKGQVLGVVTATMNGLNTLITTGTIPQNVNFAIKINYVNNLLNTLPEEVHLPNTQAADDLTPGQVMSLAKEAVVEVQTK